MPIWHNLICYLSASEKEKEFLHYGKRENGCFVHVHGDAVLSNGKVASLNKKSISLVFENFHERELTGKVMIRVNCIHVQ